MRLVNICTKRTPHYSASFPSSTPSCGWLLLAVHSRTLENYFEAAEERLLGMRAEPAQRISSLGQVYQQKRLRAQFSLYTRKVDG